MLVLFCYCVSTKIGGESTSAVMSRCGYAYITSFFNRAMKLIAFFNDNGTFAKIVF